ncbi:uncharacterized protein LOC134189296 [Corticium candelabrum]|uniref:uncharacterized protein LOC134189296 n=1 Tax=Corticium candelabrum TaxID=121492 RepID=UPI002E259F87|nr:uncharacterized protein LOC134189296 [Corticium candelabrum]XP_062513523.1 uncharacterized protein LOC134189296 [Corticium candelabrum]XP_062513530.1 uncharacterized protein LOC134189296 [Corticium candelabrum]XP_062513536.1 uncharacterized protein LOC134189296 [Corticium candelabrum]XP_062513541.1 uncharacterized protein LOC134189296 [Corticium candelabrum]
MPSASQKYWSGLVEQQMLRKLRQKEEAVAKRVRKLKLHISDIRQRFIQHANKNKIPLPIIVKSDFIFYEGMTSRGYDLVRYREMNRNTEMLMKFCQELDRCVAFTTDGTPKTRVVSIEAMIGSSRSDDSGLGLYIDDIDVCAADLRSCSKTAHCVSEGPGKYTCITLLVIEVTIVFLGLVMTCNIKTT